MKPRWKNTPAFGWRATPVGVGISLTALVRLVSTPSWANYKHKISSCVKYRQMVLDSIWSSTKAGRKARKLPASTSSIAGLTPNTAWDWPLRPQGLYFARMPIPMHVGCWYLRRRAVLATADTPLPEWLTAFPTRLGTDPSGCGSSVRLTARPKLCPNPHACWLLTKDSHKAVSAVLLHSIH